MSKKESESNPNPQSDPSGQKKEEPLQPSDYYFNEQGLMVFTESYHLKRGYCCQSGCRHCPYGFKKR